MKRFFILAKQRVKSFIRYLYPNRTEQVFKNELSAEPENKFGIASNVEFSNSSIGDYSYISPGSKIHSTTIGKFCSIGPNVTIGYGEHPVNFLSTSPLFYYGTKKFDVQIAYKDYFDHHRKVTIENDVWIGANVYVKNGIKISNGSVIAAGAVVINDIPPYAIVGGVPAKVLKYRFTSEQIVELLNIEWWNLSIQELAKHHSSFVSENISDCIEQLKVTRQ
jgi:acetyltransferase-like isoleucine patch superfamily enzyme